MSCTVLSGILVAITREPAAPVRRRIVNACMHVARETDTWPGVVDAALTGAKAADPGMREATLLLLSRISEARSDWVQPRMSEVAEAAAAGLAASQPASVRAAAAWAICSCISYVADTAEEAAVFALAVPLMIATVGELEGRGDTADARDIMQALDHALHVPQGRAIVRRVAVDATASVLRICGTDTFDEDIRKMALAMLAWIVSSAAAELRATPAHESIIPLLLRLLAKLEDTDPVSLATWATYPYRPMTEEQRVKEVAPLVAAAEESLRDVARALGGSLCLPVAFRIIPDMLAPTQSWSMRRAAVIACGVLVQACGDTSGAASGAAAGEGAMEALMAMASRGASAEPAGKGLTKEQRAHVVRLVLTGITSDTDPRVRYAAATALIMIFDTLADQDSPNSKAFCRQAAPLALPALATIINPASGNLPSVCAHAAAAIAAICSDACPLICVAPSVAPLMTALSALLASGMPAVTAQALRTIARIARRVEKDAFAHYYSTLMPGIKALASNRGAVGTGADAAAVRAAAIECLGECVEAAGVERSAADCTEVLSALLVASSSTMGAGAVDATAASGASSSTDADSAAGATLDLGRAALTALGRIGRVLGDHFAPYLPHVIPPLLAIASRDVGFRSTQIDDEDLSGAAKAGVPAAAAPAVGGGLKDSIGRLRVELSGIGQIGIELNLTAVVEKTEALSSLYDLVVDMGPAMGPYVKVIGDAVLPLVPFPTPRDARGLAVCILPVIVKGYLEYAIKKQGKPEAVAMSEVAPLLAAAILAVARQAAKETSVDGAVLSMAESLKDLLLIALTGARDEAHLFRFTDTPVLPLPGDAAVEVANAAIATAALAAHRWKEFSRELAAEGGGDAAQVELLQESVEEEAQVLQFAIDALGYTIKNARAATMPAIAEHGVSLFGEYLAGKAPTTLRHAALCVFVDACEWCGESASRYVPTLLPVLGAGLSDADALVRQVCCYGVGVLAQRQTASFAPFVTPGLTALRSVLAAPTASAPESVYATENAVSAIAKILQSCPDAVGAEQALLWRAWLQSLPLREDEMEAHYCHTLLVDMVEARSPLILGESAANVPSILKVYGEILAGSAGGGGSGAAGIGGAAGGAGADEDEDEDGDEDEPIDMASPRTLARMRNSAREILLSLGPDAAARMMSGLRDASRAALTAAASAPAPIPVA